VQTPPPNAFPQLTTTKTTYNTDADDNRNNDDHQQPVDLLAIQRDINKNMISMHSLFASLPLFSVNLGRNNKQSDRQTTAAQMTELMTINTAYPHTATCTLSGYPNQLKTPACFVPFCMLPQKLLRKPIKTYLLYHQPGQPAHTMIACECRNKQYQLTTLACLTLPNTCNAHDALQELSLANVSPNQLDHPPDQPLPCHNTHMPPKYTVNS